MPNRFSALAASAVLASVLAACSPTEAEIENLAKTEVNGMEMVKGEKMSCVSVKLDQKTGSGEWKATAVMNNGKSVPAVVKTGFGGGVKVTIRQTDFVDAVGR